MCSAKNKERKERENFPIKFQFNTSAKKQQQHQQQQQSQKNGGVVSVEMKFASKIIFNLIRLPYHIHRCLNPCLFEERMVGMRDK